MRLYAIPLLFGLLGAALFALTIVWNPFPGAPSFVSMPGAMLTFALIHASEGALGDIALIAGAAVQFVLFAIFGMFVAAASYLIA